MANVRIPQLPYTNLLDGSEEIEIAQPDPLVGYVSRRTTLANALSFDGGPSNGPFVVAAPFAYTPNARVLLGTLGNISVTDHGPGTDITLDLLATGVTPGTYGGPDRYVQVAVDEFGRILGIADGDDPIHGTVTDVSFVDANGFAATIADPTSTPSITLTTTVDGIVEGDGTALSAANVTGTVDGSGNRVVVLDTSPTIIAPVISAGTINSPTINTPTINSPTIDAGSAINGFTVTGGLGFSGGATTAGTIAPTVTGADNIGGVGLRYKGMYLSDTISQLRSTGGYPFYLLAGERSAISSSTVTPNMIVEMYYSAVPAMLQIGAVQFAALNSSSNKKTFAAARGYTSGLGTGLEDGAYEIEVISNGSPVTLIRAQGAGTAPYVSITKPLDISNAGAGQIVFPATQHPSADANTLDDYAEGTATLSCSFATPGTSSWSYTNRTFYYTKIGNVVTCLVDLVATPTIGTGSGVFTITGSPFIPAPFGPLAIYSMDTDFTWPSYRTMVTFYISSSADIYIAGQGSNVGTSVFTAANMTSGNGHTIRLGGSFLV